MLILLYFIIAFSVHIAYVSVNSWSSEDQGTQKEVDSFTAGTQTRASRARESSVTHKSAITDHAVEENHVIDWDWSTEKHSDRPDG